jgi:hypothetical protein
MNDQTGSYIIIIIMMMMMMIIMIIIIYTRNVEKYGNNKCNYEKCRLHFC